jgi:hypothetical protein
MHRYFGKPGNAFVLIVVPGGTRTAYRAHYCGRFAAVHLRAGAVRLYSSSRIGSTPASTG